MSTKAANVTDIKSAIETPMHDRIIGEWKSLHQSYSEVDAEVARHPATKTTSKLTPSRMRKIEDRDLSVVFPDKETRKAKKQIIEDHDDFVAFESLLSRKLGVAVRITDVLADLASSVVVETPKVAASK